ncbi:MAG: phytanoyl-CoA dioxygenase family protein [Chitinophagales bacterium]|nr:phytanoyl-CoA dioxygenase family protein [Chitinophagales bacterium]
MRNLFLDADKEAFFWKNGYVHIQGFLNNSECETLKQLYYKREYSKKFQGFHRTLDSYDIKDKMTICKGIDDIVSPKSKQHLFDYRYLLTSFMTKEPGAGSFDIHQNWSFVDERYFTSLVIWIPLQDTGEENGTMYFVPGSHLLDKGVRGNNIRWKYEEIKEYLVKNHMISVNMKAGDAVIFDDATIHYTSPNLSKEPRISIAQVMIPEEAQPIFYNLHPATGRLEKYAIDKDFYHLFMNRYTKTFNFSDNILLKSTIFKQEQVSIEAFEEALKEIQNGGFKLPIN